MNRFRLGLAIAMLATTAHADSFMVDFEGIATGVYDGNIGISFFTGVPGVTATLHRFGSTIEIAETFGALPGFGAQTLSPFSDSSDPTAYAWILTGTPAETIGTIEFSTGDFTPSDTDKFTITTVGPGGIASNSGIIDGAVAPGFTSVTKTVQRNGGISTMLFAGGSGGPNASSLFWDNFLFTTYDEITLSAIVDLPMGDFTGGGGGAVPGPGGGTPVPEPGTLALFGAATAAFAIYRRKRN